MKISAVTISVNYPDFLIHAIKYNLGYFDEWVIVTDTKDEETVKLCSLYKNITLVQTDVFYQNGQFEKFKGINEGLKHLNYNDWVLFIDSDIVLPIYTRRVLENLPLDNKKIYGVDRLDCYGYDNWEKYLNSSSLYVENWLLTNAGLPFGARIVHIYGDSEEKGQFTGYKPLGYFPLAHRSSFDTYPDGCYTASRCDVEFAKLFTRENRELIPELLCVHIATTDSWGLNWGGRKSGKFKKQGWLSKIFNK